MDPKRAVEFGLLFAATAGETEVIRLLIEAGTDVNAKCHHDFTALHEAAHAGHLDAVKLLVEAGARTDAVERQWSSTPEGWARHADHPEVAEYLAGR